MSFRSNILVYSAFALVIDGSSANEVKFHSRTWDPGKSRCFQTVRVHQLDGGPTRRVLGSSVQLVNANRKVLSECFVPEEFVDSEKFPTRGFWNQDGTMAALQTGGRTWSAVYFFRIRNDCITLLPEIQWDPYLPRKADGTAGEPTRVHLRFVKWLDPQRCEVRLLGTTSLGPGKLTTGAAEKFIDYEYLLTLRLSPTLVEVLRCVEKTRAGTGSGSTRNGTAGETSANDPAFSSEGPAPRPAQ